MKRSFGKSLLCALVLPLLSACGPEAGMEAEPLQPVAPPAAEAQPLDEDVVVEDVRNREDKPTVLVDAEHLFGDEASMARGLAGEKYGLVLIDRSGSMTTVRQATGATRCKDAITQAKNELNDLFNVHGRTHVAVWSFTGNSVTKHTAGYVAQADAVAAINHVDTNVPCAGLTPLADALCWGIADLSNVEPGAITHLYVATDGEENNSTQECSGPSGSPDTAGTWQNKVMAKAFSSLVKTDVAYFITPTAISLTADGDPSLAATCSTTAECENLLFSRITAQTGGEYRIVKDNNTAYPCANCPPPDNSHFGNKFTFSVSGTNSGTINTANHNIYLLAGETLSVGTCGVTGATATGDTSLRLFGVTSSQVAYNDDACGLLSKIDYVVPTTGTYQLRVGCFAGNSCSGTVAYTIKGSFNYSAANTNSAQQNTVNRSLVLRHGQRVQVGTCGVAGSSGVGDTFLRLFGLANTEVASNDDNPTVCGTGTRFSNFSYNIPNGQSGAYQLRSGCYSANSCSGTVAYFISNP